MEQMIYLLLACEEQKTLKFLKKYNSLIKQNFLQNQISVSEKFKRKLKKSFEKNKKHISLSSSRDAVPSASNKAPYGDEALPARDAVPSSSEKDISHWQNFCKHAPYEDALALVLCGILKYPLEKITWMFKIPNEKLAYRLKKGLSLLKEELKGTPNLLKSSDSKKGGASSTSSDFQQEVLAYCDLLSRKPLPPKIENIQFPSLNYKIGIYVLLGFFIVLVIFFLFRLPFSSPVILYPN